jgi:hypothetical protein
MLDTYATLVFKQSLADIGITIYIAFKAAPLTYVVRSSLHYAQVMKGDGGVKYSSVYQPVVSVPLPILNHRLVGILLYILPQLKIIIVVFFNQRLVSFLLLSSRIRVPSFFVTVIPRYTRNRFTSFLLYEMHKLIPIFQFTSKFRKYELLPLANRSLFPSGSNGKLIFVLRVFALRAVFEERIKLVHWGITVFHRGLTR